MDSINSLLNMNPLQKEHIQNICSICLGIIGDKNKATTDCAHDFCLSCLLESLQKNNTCPLCRTSLETTRPVSYKKISIDRTNKYIEEVLNNYDVSLVLYLIKNSQRNSYMNLVVHLRTMMTDLIRKLIVFQYNKNESDDEDEDEDEEYDDGNEDENDVEDVDHFDDL